MDFITMQTEVRERLGELTADFFTDAEVKRAINEGIQRFSHEAPWPWLVTEFDGSVSSASNELTLPDDVGITRINGISVTGGSIGTVGGRMLARVTAREGFKLRYAFDGHPGVPRWYYITRSNLPADDEPPVYYTAVVIPKPDTTYTVEGQYLYVPPTLSADAEEPAVPVEYQEAPVAWATGKLFLKELSISQKASEQFQVYYKVLEQAKLDTFNIDDDEVIAVGRSEPYLGRYMPTVYDRLPPTLG